MAAESTSPWLVLIHQLPPKPASLRVKVWRRLQALGSVPIKNSVYVLPNTDDAREDFEWVLREIREDGGDASLCEARLVDGLTDDEVRASFQSARESDYRQIATEVRTFARATLPRRGRALSPEAAAQVGGALARFRRRLAEVGEIDFFGAPGRESVEGLLRDLEGRIEPAGDARAKSPPAPRRREDVRGRVWVTRKGVHIDRIASAWLIRRFIDPDAELKLVASRGYAPAPGELRFDMFDAEFTHDGDLCTFEVLLRDFGLRDPGLSAIAEIVHDVDLKDSKYGRPETAGVERVIAGIAWTCSDDPDRLARGAALFDALHGAFRKRKS
ncbi:MAG TPA: chromate resistance protein ChrB domain-containing protein [Candidatus Binatia bacterium]|nr:chromate resistance protein ChrB domain-containing protein [Candidatus Binatia bacterium]